MTATRIEFSAVARTLQFPHQVSQYGYRALASQERGLDVLLIQSGMGSDNARGSAEQLLAHNPWDIIISTGFAGDLETSSIGSVLVGNEVLFGSTANSSFPTTVPRIKCHADWVQRALNIPWKGQDHIRVGKFVSVERVIITSREKHRLHVESGATGVDMESSSIGAVAQEHGVPFLIVRIISDGVSEDLPVDFNLFLSPSGWVSGIMHIITTPRTWKGFLDLYRHSRKASKQLTTFFEEFLSVVSNMPALATPQNSR